MFDLYDAAILFVILLLLYFAYQGVLMREFALKSAYAHCQKLDIQLLDQNVAIRGLWFKRDGAGKMRLWISYNFEFSSTGDERYSGRIILLGGKVINIDLPPYRLP